MTWGGSVWGGALWGYEADAYEIAGKIQSFVFIGAEPENLVGWGSLIWGGSLWGYGQTSLSGNGQIISAQIVDALTRRQKFSMEVGSSVYIDSVKQKNIRRWSISRDEGSLHSLAKVTVGKTDLGAIKGKIIEITQRIKFAEIGTIEVVRFRGFIHSAVPVSGSASGSTTITAYDLNKATMDGSTVNNSWTGTASDLILDELLKASIPVSRVSISDFTVPADATFSYSNLGSFLRDFSSEKGPADVFTLPGGEIIIQSRVDSADTPIWSLGLVCQVVNTSSENGQRRFNRVVVQAASGNTLQVDDFADQVDAGILEGGQITTQFFSTSSDLESVGLNAIKDSKTPRMAIEVPANPILTVGDIAMFQKKNGDWVKVRIIGQVANFSWPEGAWDSLKGAIIE